MYEKQLTVEELIEVLQAMPSEAPVFCSGCQMCQHPATGVDLYDGKVTIEVNTSE